ncbi:MAG: phosphomannomutase/phosphoglucomutase [Deltaproteobacteria bacterium]
MLNPQIFREYDIRGRVGEDLAPDGVERIGKGFGAYAGRQGARTVVVGRDCRLSSTSFRDALVAGLLSAGLRVIDAGICPTPLLYFSIQRFPADAGVMITGSHNPPEFNGFKLCLGAHTLHGEEIQAIRRILEKGDFLSGAGTVSAREVIPAYREFVRSNISVSRRLKVVVDAGNGTAGLVAPELFRELGVEVVELFCEMDGTFPNHFPDPTIPENLRHLVQAVRENGADVGVGYDGDADRIGAVDERGRILFGDSLLLLFAREILSRKPGATVISEVKASQTLYDDIARRGGRAVMWKAGHSLIKQKMKEEGAEIAGEMSGHIFFADRYLGFDDAIYASARLFELLAASDRPLSGMLSDLPPVVATPEIRVDCPDGEKFRVARRVAEIVRPLAREVIEIDGVRALFDGGWGLVRASNTQPVLVLRFEGQDDAAVGRIRSLLEEAVRQARAEGKG